MYIIIGNCIICEYLFELISPLWAYIGVAGFVNCGLHFPSLHCVLCDRGVVVVLHPIGFIHLLACCSERICIN